MCGRSIPTLSISASLMPKKCYLVTIRTVACLYPATHLDEKVGSPFYRHSNHSGESEASRSWKLEFLFAMLLETVTPLEEIIAEFYLSLMFMFILTYCMRLRGTQMLGWAVSLDLLLKRLYVVNILMSYLPQSLCANREYWSCFIFIVLTYNYWAVLSWANQENLQHLKLNLKLQTPESFDFLSFCHLESLKLKTNII